MTTLKSVPPRSDLVMQRYDAYVIDKDNGTFDIETLKPASFKSSIRAYLSHSKVNIVSKSNSQGLGVNIIGFMLMVLLVGSCMNMFTLADDKAYGPLARIFNSPFSLTSYLASNCIYNFMITFLPAFLMLCILKLLHFDIGFSLANYAILLIVLGVFGVSFALLFKMLFKKPDDANMFSNIVITLTSVLSGCFYSSVKGSAVFDNLVKFLPQKQYMLFAMSLQNKTQGIWNLLYVLIFSAVLFAISTVMLSRLSLKK